MEKKNKIFKIVNNSVVSDTNTFVLLDLLSKYLKNAEIGEKFLIERVE